MATRAVTKKAASSANIVSIQEELKRQAAAIGEKVAPPGGDVIQVTQDKRFKLPDGTVSNGPLSVVIVDFISANYFYQGQYDPNNITPPACFALGQSPTTLAPSDNSPLKQSEGCAGCPMNQFGSDGNGKPPVQVKHNALHDALYQAQHLAAIWKLVGDRHVAA